MILKIKGDVEILIDSNDVERVLRIIRKNCMWHMNKQQIVYGWCNTKKAGRSKFLLSRVIMNCYDSAFDVDHENHNKLDFRKSNLRVCSHQENCFNTRHAVGKTGFRGVTIKKGMFYSQIRTKNGRKSLGYFHTAEAASKAYEDAVILYHGNFRVTKSS